MIPHQGHPRPDWKGHTAVVVGAGPSVTDEQLAHLKMASNVRTIAVNSSAFAFDWWDIAYSGDYLWWKHCAMVRKTPNLLIGRSRSVLWTCDKQSAERWLISWVRGTHRPGLARDGSINTHGNSGAQAVNLAHLLGARRILLIGFDMKLGAKGEKHHHADHPAPCVQAQLFEEWIHKFEPLAKGLWEDRCKVINCTPGTALPWFPKANLEDVLP